MPEEEKKAPSWVDYLSQAQKMVGKRDDIQPFEPGTRTLQGWGAEHDFMRWYLGRLELMAARAAAAEEEERKKYTGHMGGWSYRTPNWTNYHDASRSWMTSFGGSGYPKGHPFDTSSKTSSQAPAAAAPASGSNWWQGLL